jgi:hypothetical protein
VFCSFVWCVHFFTAFVVQTNPANQAVVIAAQATAPTHGMSQIAHNHILAHIDIHVVRRGCLSIQCHSLYFQEFSRSELFIWYADFHHFIISNFILILFVLRLITAFW